VPIADPRLERAKQIKLLQGEIPSPIDPPSGCVFRTRCPHAMAICAEQVPQLKALDAKTEVACWLY